MRYARRCDATGKGMNEGFCFGSGENYFADKFAAEIQAILIGYDSLEEAYDNCAYYWTEWSEEDIEEQGYYYTEDGKEIAL